MSERYGHSKGKIYKNYQEISPKSKRIKKRAVRHHDTKHSDLEYSRTPPLPNRRTTTIDELIIERRSLKKQLKKIKQSEKHSSSKSVTSFDKAQNDSNHDKGHENHNRKRVIKNKTDNCNVKRKSTGQELIPEPTGDNMQIDSEDEETLIEKSRLRRKMLLEKLNISQDKIVNDQSVMTTEQNKKSMRQEADNIKSEVANTVINTTDMFSENDEFAVKNEPEKVVQDNQDENNSQLIDNWDDSEGYYNIRIGDEIDKGRYTIKSILGQGVFSNVVRAKDNDEQNTDVAIKIIRNNLITYKTGIKEIEILKQIKEADPENKHHCIDLKRNFIHKNHLCLVLESLYMDLRHIIKKYGHHHGLHMKATMSYSRQLLCAMRLLKKLGIVHADIKPDNILVNEKKNILKLGDFGSASKADEIEATPYLVSRFYRAPEIILGIPYTHSIDVWSAACTMYEIATGKIMFPGSSNNKMLKCFMDLKGKFPTKFIKKGKFKDQHFNYNNNFLLHKKDQHTGREKYVEIPHIPITRDLQKDFKKYCKNTNENEEIKLLQLKDLLEKMVILDSNYRYTVSDCLKHSFIRDDIPK